MTTEADHPRPFRFHLRSAAICFTLLCIWLGFLSWHKSTASCIIHFVFGLSLWVAAFRLDLPWLYVPGAIIFATGFIVLAKISG